jgi:head-tail adaptor
MAGTGAGTLDRTIEIQEFAPLRTATGSAEKHWAFLMHRSANISPASTFKGDEYFRDSQVQADSDMVFTVRWEQVLVDRGTSLRIVSEGRTFDVKRAFEPMHTRRDWLMFLARETK